MNAHLVIAPILVLMAGAVVLYLVASRLVRSSEALAATTAAFFALALGIVVVLVGQERANGVAQWPIADPRPAFRGEPGGLLIAATCLSLGLLVALFSGTYLALDRRYEDYYPLLLLLGAAVIAMVMASDLFVLYLAATMVSAATYVLVGFRRQTETAIEAGVKYVLIGGVASVLMLFGVGLVLRAQGTLTLPIANANGSLFGYLGVSLLVAALSIKSALVPGHTWLPDAHSRAPSSVSALLSGIIVQGHLYVLVKVVLGSGLQTKQIGAALMAMAAATMLLGNLMALQQIYGKRLLAYSSVAQLGYILSALAVGITYRLPAAIAAGLFLIVAHAVSKGLAFLCKGALHYYCDSMRLPDLDGVAQRMPAISACMALGLASLAGFAPLAGFLAKLAVLRALLTADSISSTILAAVFLLSNAISLAYYVPMLARPYRRGGSALGRVRPSPWILAPIAGLAVLVALLGLFPGILGDLPMRAGVFVVDWGSVQ